jgi:hypothetical protein
MLLVPQGVSSSFPAGKNFSPRQISEAPGLLGQQEPGRGVPEVHNGASERGFVCGRTYWHFYEINRQGRKTMIEDGAEHETNLKIIETRSAAFQKSPGWFTTWDLVGKLIQACAWIVVVFLLAQCTCGCIIKH